jgi:hypothetical protein
MLRTLLPTGLTLAALLFLLSIPARSFDDGPPIVIKSPDTATTFAFAMIKQHVLLWDKKNSQLLAHIVFTPVDGDDGASIDQDEHDFRLPGVTFDEKKGLFFATSASGESIPIARIKKTLFLSTVEPMPNANVIVQHPHGEVSVVLEAIRPDDPAMHPAPAAASGETDSEGNKLHSVDIPQLLH